jgi:uncharacterized protein (TIGR00369 family)
LVLFGQLEIHLHSPLTIWIWSVAAAGFGPALSEDSLRRGGAAIGWRPSNNTLEKSRLDGDCEMTQPVSEKESPEGPPADVAVMNAHNAAIPFNSWLGVEVISADDSGVRLRVPWRVEFGGSPGMTHGGILAGIVDLGAYMALMAVKGGGGPTIDMRIDHHRSMVNGTLYAESRILRVGSTISTVEVDVRDAQRRLIASGRCVFLSRSRRHEPET